MIVLRSCLLLLLLATAGLASGAEPPGGETPNRAALEKQFTERLQAVVLEGTYTTTGEEAPKPDRYEIASVAKLQGDLWLFQAKYGDTVLPPLPLRVLWAGDTPVISMNDFTIPALGTFSFRVMIHGDLYAGTWKHDEKGGHMTGVISKKSE
jgi:hypothetical protein